MATLPPGTRVTVLAKYVSQLAFPPDARADLIVSVHRYALKAGARNRLTQLIGFDGTEIIWAGAVDEQMLSSVATAAPDPRPQLAGRLLQGSQVWDVVEPGPLLAPGARRPLLTVYDGQRPWIVVGELSNGDPLAVPLNDPSNPKWFTPVVQGNELDFPGSKRSHVELAHLWSFSGSTPVIGSVLAGGQRVLEAGIRRYFGI